MDWPAAEATSHTAEDRGGRVLRGSSRREVERRARSLRREAGQQRFYVSNLVLPALVARSPAPLDRRHIPLSAAAEIQSATFQVLSRACPPRAGVSSTRSRGSRTRRGL